MSGIGGVGRQRTGFILQTPPENRAIGVFLCSAWYKSLITPPTIVLNTELPTPVQNRATIIPGYDLVTAQHS
jgi:hypothetical protein